MDELKYATFGQRVLAYIIDLIIIYVIFIVSCALFGVMLGLFGLMDFDTQSTQLHIIYNIGLIAISFLYYAIQESSDAKATIGKKVLGLQVVNYENRKITFSQACGRYISKMLSSLVFCLGYLAITWTEKSQGWHDSIAKTLVVNQKLSKENYGEI